MDKTDLVRQLSNLVTQISGTSKTSNQPVSPGAEASAQLQTQMREALIALIRQEPNAQILARLAPSQTPPAPVIPVEPRGDQLLSVLIKGQLFVLKTALDLKPGLAVRLILQGNNLTLQPGPISPPTAQLNAEIQRLVAQVTSTAPPPLNTQQLQQPVSGSASSSIDNTQLRPLLQLLQQLPALGDLSQPSSLAQLINAQRPPLVQQLQQVIGQLNTSPNQPIPATPTPAGPATSPGSAATGTPLTTPLLPLGGNQNLPLLVTTLVQQLGLAAPIAQTAQPEAQPLALQLPSLHYPFPQRSSPSERPQDVGALLKRMAHWFKASQEQQQLHQLLQLQSSNPGDDTARPAPHLWLEIPFRVDQQLHWLQLNLQREPVGGKDSSEQDLERQDQVWQLQLRLERPETGAVYASVYFRKPKLDVQFWAEQPDTLNELRASLSQFTDLLKSEGVEECTVAANPGAMQANQTPLDQRRLHLEA